MEWIKIEGCENYEINEDGVIISYMTGLPKKMKPRKGKNGRKKVNLINNNGKRITRDVDTLVYEAFNVNAGTTIRRQRQNITLRNIKTGEVRSWDTIKGCAREIGSHPKSLRNLRQGKAKTAKGWEIVQD